MDRNETAFANFVKSRIEKGGGSVQVKYLCQLLPTLEFELRKSVAGNQTELMKFLRKYSNIFKVDANGNVKLQSIDASEPPTENVRKKDKFYSSEHENKLPDLLSNGEGVIIKVNPTFGFISSKIPFKTNIYFTPACFGNKSKTLFDDFEELTIGKKICFNAKLSCDDKYSKYRATRVWYPKTEAEKNRVNNQTIEEWERSVRSNQKQTKGSGLQQKIPNNLTNNIMTEEINSSKLDDKKSFKRPTSQQIIPKSRKSRETGLYDPLENEGDGEIVKLFPNFGFISIDKDLNNTVFFYKSQICNYENVLDLTKILRIGDVVEFKAVRATNKNTKARWSASKVWIKKSITPKINSKSSTESNIPFAAKRRDKKCINNEAGKIFPHASGTVIKFGKNFNQLADADSSIFYILGTKVVDVSWEFSEGDNVYFDAIEIKSHPGWKATLVWTGLRPNVVLDYELENNHEHLEVESVPDSASCISKSSDNSTHSGKSGNKFGPSSGYSSLKTSRENINRSTMFDSQNKKYHDKNIDCDDFSDTASYVSNYSNSDTGSKHLRHSKNRRRKNNNNWRENSPIRKNKSYISKSSEKFVQHQEFVPSPKRSLPQKVAEDTLSVKSNSSLTFLSEDRVYTDWGDSPYPDGENESNSEEDFAAENTLSKNTKSSPEPNMNILCNENDSLLDSDKSVYISDDEDFDDLLELAESVKLKESDENKDNDLAVDSDSEEEPNRKAKITHFSDIEGTVMKVYCKFATLENPDILNKPTLLWNDLYRNGIPVSDDGIDDLREVIEVGDKLKFNCIEIINEEGNVFNKVTMAWLDVKPHIDEISVAQFVSNMGLPINLDEINVNEYCGADNKKVNHQNAEEVEVLVRRFLSVLSDSEEDPAEKTAHGFISATDDLPDVLPNKDPIFVKQLEENRTEVYDNKRNVINDISEIMKSSGLASQSQVDLNAVSSRILDFVLKSCSINQIESSNVQHASDSKEEGDNNAQSQLSDSQTEKQFSDVAIQTIFTGDVIGKNIYTLC